MTVTEGKTIAQMEAEVEAYCRDKGWYDQEVPFAVAMALLHEEIAEAGHAWRDHGLADATKHEAHVHDDDGTVEGCPGCFHEPKPEGVGSEFADILIRLLDDSSRYGLDLAYGRDRTSRGFAPVAGDFLADVNTMHGLVARASAEWAEEPSFAAINLAVLLVFLEVLCERYGIDLAAEYERKMKFNKTRPYRHGGRRA
jgi:NTP pyrophosphatase (non-canonical NTP hydrolase)